MAVYDGQKNMLTTPPLSLYVHLPWCVRKCPYCDFNSHERKGELPFDAYVDALIRDLDFDLPLAWGRVVHSVFFGGGTPSLMSPETVAAILQEISKLWGFAPDVEITLEEAARGKDRLDSAKQHAAQLIRASRAKRNPPRFQRAASANSSGTVRKN